MQTGPAWILGIAMTALFFVGLVIASQTHDPIMYYVGLAFCLFAVLFNYGLISRHGGQTEGR